MRKTNVFVKQKINGINKTSNKMKKDKRKKKKMKNPKKKTATYAKSKSNREISYNQITIKPL